MTGSALPLRRGETLAEAAALCVLVHGRGQSPETMELAIVQHLTTPGVAFVVPRAPSGAWYAARAIDPLTETSRRQLADSLDALATDIGDAFGAARPGTPLLLAGFSQGACLALEYALTLGPWHGALACLTGCRVGVASDDRPLADLAGLPVYLTGSDADSWIPVPAWAEAAAALGKARARLRAELFPGRTHEPSRPEIAVLDTMLSSLAAGKAPWQ